MTDFLEIKAEVSIDDTGTVTGVAWPFGSPDSVGDVIEKGAFAFAKSLPMVMAWIKVKTANLLDTTDPEVAKAINPFLETEKTHWRAIQDRRESMSQAIGRAIHEVCFSGLIATSQASPGSKNIVIFPRKLKSQEKLSAPSLKTLD